MKPIYQNNRTAPRMRKGSFSKSIVTKELWKTFIKSCPEYSQMTWDEFFSYWKDIAEVIRVETVTNPLGVKLGSYTGELKLQYLPYKFEAFIKNTDEIGQRIKHPNIVTKGKVAKIKWERRWAVRFNKMLQFYGFTATREIDIMAKDHIQKNPDNLRVARSTTGGYNRWKQTKNK